ncbi:MAG: hypothetical protein ACOX81_08145 [Candidatus Heteroscillospira sp.]|jgi:hypothetical protein
MKKLREFKHWKIFVLLLCLSMPVLGCAVYLNARGINKPIEMLYDPESFCVQFIAHGDAQVDSISHILGIKLQEIDAEKHIYKIPRPGYGEIAVYFTDSRGKTDKNTFELSLSNPNYKTVFLSGQQYDTDRKLLADEFQEKTLWRDETNTVSISGAMSFDELMQRYVDTAGRDMEISDILPIDNSSSIGFRVLSVPLMAETGYVPRLEFYCRTEEGSSAWGISSVLAVHVLGVDGDKFVGNVDSWLRSAHSIEYVVNGDFIAPSETSGKYCYQHETHAFQR